MASAIYKHRFCFQYINIQVICLAESNKTIQQ